jgi:FkbM family methyltransferase
MIDVGTNFIIGIHNNYEEVHCIEPIPEICNWLKNNTNYNIHEFAVDNFIGQREFGISKIVDGHQKMGCSSLYEFTDDKNGWTKMRDDFQFDKKINVNVITMENFIQNNDIKNIEYFQCDAQGSDLNVLKSFGKYINIIEEGRIEVANSVELYKGVDNTFPSAKKFLEENNFKITNWDMIEKWEDKPEIDVEFKRK